MARAARQEDAKGTHPSETLPGTFLQACSNTRTDKYGGDADGRFRLLSEVVTRVAAELGKRVEYLTKLIEKQLQDEVKT